MKTISSLLLIGLFVVSCEKNRDANDLNDYDNTDFEETTIPMSVDPMEDTLGTDRSSINNSGSNMDGTSMGTGTGTNNTTGNQNMDGAMDNSTIDSANMNR